MRRSPGALVVVLLGLVAGGAAGLASWGVGEWAREVFAPTFDMPRELASNAVTSTAEVGRQKRVALLQTAAVSYGTLGAFLGLSLGLVGGFAGGTPSRGRAAAAIGFLLGGAACAGATQVLIPTYLRVFQESKNHLSHDLLFPMLIHGGMWAGAGLAGGLAMGLGAGGWRRAAAGAFGGALGAVLGTLAYEIAGGIAFPLASTSSPMPTSPAARLVAHLSVGLLVALASAWALRPSSRAVDVVDAP